MADQTVPATKPASPWWMMPTRASQLVIDQLKRVASGGFFERLSGTASRLGLMALIISSAAIALFQIVLAIRTDSLSNALYVVAIPVVLCVLQYTAARFMDMAETIVRNTPTSASGLVLYDLIGLVLFLAGVGLGGMGIYAALRSADPQEAVLGVFALLGLCTVGIMFLTPSALNLWVNERSTAGEDGLSVIGTLIKAYLASSRLIFGSCALIGGLACVIGSLWFVFDSTDPRPLAYLLAGLMLVVYGAILPLAFYLLAIFYFILVDALLAIMRMTPAGRR